MTTTTEKATQDQQRMAALNLHAIVQIRATMFRLDRSLREHDLNKARHDIAAAWQALSDMVDRDYIPVE